MRRAIVASLVLLASLWPSPSADAAMVVRMVVDPSPPIARMPATVSVRTLAPFDNKCVDDQTADHKPWSDWHTSDGSLRLSVEAALDGVAPIVVDLTRREGDPTWWDGSLVFTAPGAWTLRMSHPTWSQTSSHAEACAGARIVVAVVDRLPATATQALPGADAVSLIGAVVLWLQRFVRARS